MPFNLYIAEEILFNVVDSPKVGLKMVAVKAVILGCEVELLISYQWNAFGGRSKKLELWNSTTRRHL